MVTRPTRLAGVKHSPASVCLSVRTIEASFLDHHSMTTPFSIPHNDARRYTIAAIAS